MTPLWVHGRVDGAQRSTVAELCRPPPPEFVGDLRAGIDAARAVLFCTPEYAGAMPGSLKNLLEWTIGATVMTGKPVGWINPSTAPQRAAGIYDSLKTVLNYTGASLGEGAAATFPSLGPRSVTPASSTTRRFATGSARWFSRWPRPAPTSEPLGRLPPHRSP